MMTKKDYIAIAKAINAERYSWSVTNLDNLSMQHVQNAIAYTAQRIANVLQDDNPRFDRVRFLKACGVEL